MYKKKNTYILINSLNKGGAERQVSIIEEYIATKIFLWEDNISYNTKNQIEFLENPPKNKIYGAIVFFYIFKMAIYLKNRIRNEDIIISFMEKNNFINIIASFFSKHKIIICERTQPSVSFKGFSGEINKILIRILYPFSKYIIANSDGVKEDLINNFNIKQNKISVIYNAFDKKFIIKSSKEKIEKELDFIFKNKKVIITVGRLTDAKGHWHLIRAMQNIVNNNPNIVLFIIGEGKLKGYLLKLIEELDLKNNVYLLGNKDNPFSYVVRAKLFILSSLWEGFPNALVEAMFCQIPVISTNCKSGPGEILNENIKYNTINHIIEAKYGILIPTPDGNKYRADENLKHEEQIMAYSILNMFNNSDLYEKYKNKSTIRSNDFTVENIIPKWKDYLNNNFS